MKLKSISYKENIGRKDANPWNLEKLILGEQNLIIAKNATGKSRILSIICSLAQLIQTPLTLTGVNGMKNTAVAEWYVIFDDNTGRSFEYSVSVDKGKITHEKITVDGHVKLTRQGASAEIHSYIEKKPIQISPPDDCLVLHIRRDQNEFPYLEELVSWAHRVRGLSFANTSPAFVEIPTSLSQMMISLNSVPFVLEHLSASQLKKVYKQLHQLDYDIEDAKADMMGGMHPSAKFLSLKERSLNIPLPQNRISQGMFRTFSLLVILEYYRSRDQVEFILIDDLGEGLDFDRGQKLAKMIFEESGQSKLQVIATSNVVFLMNSVPLNDLTICYRSGHSVKCFNNSNSPEKFDKWRHLGLENFDLLSSNFLLD